MNDSNLSSSRRSRDDLAPSQADQEVIAELYDQIAKLQDTVRALQTSRDRLKLDHQALQEENQRLRREMTLAHLIEDLEASIEEVVGEEPASPPSASTPPARELYECLPSTFLFPVFFRMADETGVETEEARRALVRYLADGLLVQSGAYLRKQRAA